MNVRPAGKWSGILRCQTIGPPDYRTTPPNCNAVEKTILRLRELLPSAQWAHFYQLLMFLPFQAIERAGKLRFYGRNAYRPAAELPLLLF